MLVSIVIRIKALACACTVISYWLSSLSLELPPWLSLAPSFHIDGFHCFQNYHHRSCKHRHYILMVSIVVRTTCIDCVFSSIHITRFFHDIPKVSIVIWVIPVTRACPIFTYLFLVRIAPIVGVFSSIHIILIFYFTSWWSPLSSELPLSMALAPYLHINGLHCGKNYPGGFRVLCFPHHSVFFYITYRLFPLPSELPSSLSLPGPYIMMVYILVRNTPFVHVFSSIHIILDFVF